MISEPKADEVTVTREHRETAAQLTYWPGAWRHRQVLDWCATGAINDGISPKMAMVAGALAAAERRGRVSAENGLSELLSEAWRQGYAAAQNDCNPFREGSEPFEENPYEAPQPTKET